MLKKLSFAIFSLVIAFCAMAPVRADDVPDNAFYLKNDSDQTLHFRYKCSDGSAGPWDKTIAAEDANWYWAKNGCDTYIIEKTTSYDDSSERTFRYTLTAGHRYRLMWNSRRDAWDIKELSD